MAFRVEIRRAMHPNFHVLLRKLREKGYPDSEVMHAFSDIATAHNSGRRPDGVVELAATELGYPRYGFKIFGVWITYHIRPPDLVVIEYIDP